MISGIENLVYELSHELPNDLRVRILGNKKILGKSQLWVDTSPSAKSLFQKLNIGSSSQKTRKSRYQTFLVLSSFTGFLYFVRNVLPRVMGWLKSHQKLRKMLGKRLAERISGIQNSSSSYLKFCWTKTYCAKSYYEFSMMIRLHNKIDMKLYAVF